MNWKEKLLCRDWLLLFQFCRKHGGCFPFPPVHTFFHSLDQGQLSSAPCSLPFGSVPFPFLQPMPFKMQTGNMGKLSQILLFALKGGAYRAGPSLALWKTLGTPPSIFYHFIVKIMGETGIYRLTSSLLAPLLSFSSSLLAQRMPQK